MKINENGEVLWDWREYFSQANLTFGEQDCLRGGIVFFECDPEHRWANGRTDNGFIVKVNQAPANYAEFRNYPDWRQLERPGWRQSKRVSTNYYSCNCSQGAGGTRCRHLAALMFRWEKQHGPFVMHESEADRAERLRQEVEAALEARRKQLEEEKKKNFFDASEYFKNRVKSAPQGLFFPVDSILSRKKLQTNQYESDQADALMAEDAVTNFWMEIDYDFGDSQLLSVSATVDGRLVQVALNRETIVKMECACHRSKLSMGYYRWDREEQRSNMCCHALALWFRLREAIIRDNPGDETDFRGARLLSLLTGTDASDDQQSPIDDPAERKRPCLMLTPRITRDNVADTLKLCFDLGRTDGRGYALKSLASLVKAVDEGAPMALSKTFTARFDEETFTEDSMKWYQMITSRVRAVNSVNARLGSGYYHSSRALSIGAGIPMEESDLDIVYDMTEGGDILYQRGGRSQTSAIRVERASPKVELRLDPIRSKVRVTGISITGAMPRMLRGSLYQYTLDTDCFGRVDDGELAFLTPFKAISGPDGSIRCTIGEKKMAEFCYRVLPALQEMPRLTLTDNVSDLVEGLLPPEPKFTFYIDLDERLTCRPTVQYDDQTYPLDDRADGKRPERRDIDQENRVLAAVRGFFPQRDPQAGQFCLPADEDSLMLILTDGVRALSRFGVVKGSDAFNRVRVRPAPQPRLSVQIEGGLLDLSIRTKDMSDDELLALLDSYRLKKRWHRLRSGDFVDLRDTLALDELDRAVRAMDVSIEALVGDGVQLPKYRALYVDKMLEAHNDVAAARDKHFKALVRSFQTIRDSDFDAPEALSDVLRPYQLYGFRWLSTLSQAGFGGILADEMGLGKTVQMLAYIQALRDRGEERPAIVVCPASLVYNWREECRRFTPGLSVGIIAGTLSQRRAQIKAIDGDTALFVTSYDLLKRDIALYDGVVFSTIVLDEAQYVKNQHAAVSKAVRVLKGEHRFALTGTPIENRLSELWSIFDFLMPGFLYTAKAFSERFETPIMKQKDAAATSTLARMTEPFILRRRKEDVLNDLPEKLEENRRAEMEPDQRRLYDAQLVQMRNVLAASGDTGEDKLRVLAQITRLRQLCCDPSLLFDDYRGSSAKRAACLELIQSAIDAGHRMLVFSQFTSMLALLAADLTEAGIPFYTLTGSTPKQERVRLVNAFNRGDTPVFLISLKAGGTGLNLTGADVVIHYDPWWNLAVQNQATDRAHRIGQTRQVTVVKLIAADTIEEKIVELQQTKRDLAEAILSGRNTSLMSLSKEELLALLE